MELPVEIRIPCNQIFSFKADLGKKNFQKLLAERNHDAVHLGDFVIDVRHLIQLESNVYPHKKDHHHDHGVTGYHSFENREFHFP